MARVTVEDCIDKVENRFDLVLLASHRARMISSGAPITIDRDNDKNPVVALREIAETTISPDDLKEELVHSLQKYVEVDEPEPAAVPLIGAPGATVDADDTEVTSRSGIKVHPGTFGLAGASLSVGKNTGSPVSRAYKAPFPFTGGTIAQVNVDVSGKPYVDLEREFARAFAKD